MCGIVGIFSKSPAISEQLGTHVARMLVQMEGRGPDSAGVAFYRDPVEPGASKLSLYAPEGDADWSAVEARLAAGLGVERAHVVGPRHALFVVGSDADDAQACVAEHLPELRVMSAGR
jgi:asparagine synthetase B (glutamine-hydrolysing)